MKRTRQTNSKRSKSRSTRDGSQKRKSGDFDIAFTDILDVFRRRFGLILGAMLLSTGLAAAYYMMLAPKFESRAEVLVERKDPTFATDGANSNGDSDVSRDLMATHMRIVQSRRNVRAALEESELVNLPSITEQLGDNTTPVDYVVDNLYVTTGGEGSARDAHVINLRMRHTEPEDSKTILEAIVAQYQKFLRAKYEDDNTQAHTLINEARLEMEKELATLEEEYREFRTSAPILVTGEESSNIYVQRYEDIQAEISEVESQITEATTRLSLVREGIERYNDKGVPDLQKLTLIDAINAERLAILMAVDRGEAETASFQAEQPERMAAATSEFSSLLEKKTQLSSMENSLGKNHPEVVSLRAQVRLAEEFMESKAKLRNVPEDKPALTPGGIMDAYVSLLDNDLDALRQRKTALLAAAADTETSVRSLVDFELQGEYLVHERMRKQDLYDGTVDTLRSIALSKGAGSSFIHEVLESPEMGKRVEPNLLTAAAIALFGTVVLGTVLVGISELSDRSVHKPEELEQIFSAQVLSHVPDFSRDQESRQALRLAKQSGSPWHKSLLTYHAPQSRMAEVFRGLRTQLMFAAGDHGRIIGVTSAKSGEGKSTVAANVACSFAQTGRRVLLVDCDMRRPQVHQLFAMGNEAGICGVLDGSVELNDAIISTELPNLYVLPSGGVPSNPAELLDGQTFDDFLATVREQYDLVIVDCPPVLPVSDPSIIAPKVDGMLVVVTIGAESRPQAARVKQVLTRVAARPIGVVINRSSNAHSKYGYGAYDYESYRPAVKTKTSVETEEAVVV